jgi:hypothetical protein
MRPVTLGLIVILAFSISWPRSPAHAHLCYTQSGGDGGNMQCLESAPYPLSIQGLDRVVLSADDT